MTSTPRPARPAWPRTAPPGRCTPPTTARCTRSSAPRTARPPNIGPLSAGGVRQRGGAGLVLRGHDLRHHRDLRPVGQRQQPHPGARGGAAGGPDDLANADRGAGQVGGHKAYGVYIAPGMGYRDDSHQGHRDRRRGGGRVQGHSTARTTTTAAASTTATPRPTTATTATAPWKPSTSATRLLVSPAPAPARGSWPTWRTACSPAATATTPANPTQQRPRSSPP